MSAEERAPLAAAGRARFLGRLQECKKFASLEAGKAYRRQRLLELAAAIQEDIENNQREWAAGCSAAVSVFHTVSRM
jgi:hypothetical protein